MEDLRVKDVMSKTLVVITPGKTVRDAAKLMDLHDVGSVIVVERSKAKGILTERDIVRRVVKEGLDAKEVKVQDVMSSPLIVIDENDTIEEAAEVMKKAGVKRLPVVNKDGMLVGIISEDDILKVFPPLVELIKLKAEAFQE